MGEPLDPALSWHVRFEPYALRELRVDDAGVLERAHFTVINAEKIEGYPLDVCAFRRTRSTLDMDSNQE